MEIFYNDLIIIGCGAAGLRAAIAAAEEGQNVCVLQKPARVWVLAPL